VEQEKLERTAVELMLSRAAGLAGKHGDIGCDSIAQLEQKISVFRRHGNGLTPGEGTSLTIEGPLFES
jgi:hypothetical protein